MREIIINLNNIPARQPIFAKLDGYLAGMVVQETKGWILRIGGQFGASGHFKNREDCIIRGQEMGYTFYVEER